MSIYEDFMKKQAISSDVSVQPEEDNFLTDVLSSIGDALKQPAAAALEGLSYLDKPRGAIAGAVKAFQDDTDLLEGAESGWDKNTSWKETFDQDWVKENPTTASVAGLAADILADPLWLLTPAKIAGTVAKGSKALGVTDNLINPAVKAIEETDAGKNIIAKAQDWSGHNRLDNTGVIDEFNMGRAGDRVINQDYVDELGKLKKEYGEEADKGANYLEALERQTPTGNTTLDVVKATEDGSIYKHIKDGTITRDEAFNALRSAGSEIPDQLLQTHQRQFLLETEKELKALQIDLKTAKDVGNIGLIADIEKAIKDVKSGKTDNLPEYIHRDQVLAAIPNESLRRAIQTTLDPVIEMNKKYSDAIYDIGRIGDKEYVEFMGGSHLRRSYEQFQTADDFLKSVRKNGTPEEWENAFSAYQKQKAGVGPSSVHKIDQRDFMKRQTLSEETMKKMGVITDTQYRVADTFNRASKTLNENTFLGKVNELFGKSQEEAAMLSRNLPKSREYIPIPESKAYGALAGKWVPKDVANQVLKLTGTNAKPGEIAGTWQKLVSWFKVAKLANPASTMRNMYSGMPMAAVYGKVPLYLLPREIKHVIGSFADGKKNNPFIREFRASGAVEGEWVDHELNNILGKNAKGIKKLPQWGMGAFGAPDKFWRAVVYSYHRRQGKSVLEAGSIAKKALLDYSSAPEWINFMSRNGIIPFAKFPFLAGKATAKAVYENPARVTQFTKAQNQTDNSTDRDKILPEYMKAKTLLPTGDSTRMVNGKPQKVQGNIDLSYILPFANDFKLGNPITDAMTLAATGKNGIGQQIIKPGMSKEEQAKTWGNFLWNGLGPSMPLPYNYAGEKLSNAVQGKVDSKGRQYDLTDALLQTVGGIKNVPINNAEMYQNKMTGMKSEMNSIKAMLNRTAKDQSLTAEQKKERIADYVSQLKHLGKQMQDASQAYKRLKD